VNIKSTLLRVLASCVKLEWFYIREYLLLVEMVHTTDICCVARGFSMPVGSKHCSCTSALRYCIKTYWGWTQWQ